MPSRLLRRLARPAFFAVVATGLMAPLASNTLVPNVSDLPTHIAAAWQARLALDEGQFPLRTAPQEREGRRYAMLQLYGQFPYTIAAVLQKVVLPDTPHDMAVQMLDRLRAIVATLDWSAFSDGLKVTISAGVATLAKDELPDTLLARADAALYAAKAQGRNLIASA